MATNNTRLIDLTVGELFDLIDNRLQRNETKVDTIKFDDKYVYGVSGIAKLLGVSKTMVHQYKDDWLKPAIMQNGRKIICDAPLAIELFGKRKK